MCGGLVVNHMMFSLPLCATAAYLREKLGDGTTQGGGGERTEKSDSAYLRCLIVLF